MGRKCAVEDCLSDSSRPEDTGVTFHKVPMHTDIRPKWFVLCHIPEDKRNFKIIYVCSRHFLRADFCNFKGKKYMLRHGVLPSVFPWDKSKLEAIKAEATIKKELDETSEDGDKIIEGEATIKCEEVDIKCEVKEEPISEDISAIEAKYKEKNIEEPRQGFSGTINFAINSRIEVLDFNNSWYPARIVEVDYEENEVLIHFEKFSSKFDEWICMDSPRLRVLQPASSKKSVPQEQYAVGERCLANWSDSRKFPATVTRIMENDLYEVLFDDGFVKTVKSNRMSKTQGKTQQSSPLFDPVKGTKQERRDRKRKINVAALFGKRSRTENAGEKEKPKSSTSAYAAETYSPSPTLEPEDPQGYEIKWELGRPVGKESYVEMNDSRRKSVIVADSRLPPGWKKHFVQRTVGHSAGKWDCIMVSPENCKFRTRTEIRTFCDNHPDLAYNESMFDFRISTNRQRQRSKTEPKSLPTQETIPPLAPINPDQQPPPAEEVLEEEEPANLLKIPLIDDAYKCPIEGCGKNFRRENLAQMHVKHYHPEYTKFLDCTPNVADLAYARTVGDNLEKSPAAARPSPARQILKIAAPKPAKLQQSPLVESEVKPESPTPSKNKDAEIIKLLSAKPFDKKEVDSIQPIPSGLPSNMYPEINLKDLLNKAEGVPKQNDLNLKTLCATRPPIGIKTLLPVVRTPDIRDNNPFDSVGKQSIKRKRGPSENFEYFNKGNDLPPPPYYDTPTHSQSPPLLETQSLFPLPPNNIIIEGGEVIKIVRMKQEEIINCTCGFTEEDGLMIQCELCLCWQHAYCNNIERESQVPDKYICYICQNPVRERLSKKYYHDQDWLKQGTLPTGSYHSRDNGLLQKRFEKLKKSHDVSGGLLELRDYVHNLNVKLKIAEAKNHPKLYLWSKPWDKPCLPEKIKQENDTKTKIAPDMDIIKHEPNESMLMMMLKNEDKDILRPIIPKPEAAIDSADCRLNLLDHIAHSEALVEERLDDFEEVIASLEEGTEVEKSADYPRIRQTLQMLLRDLDTLREFSQVTSIC